MSKSIKNSFYKKLTFDSLINAHDRARINKNYKKEVLLFNIDLETNICNILKKLKENTYTPGIYRTFTIYEPKERIIKSLPYVDRIIQQWYIYEFIKPYVIPRLINSTCACVPGKGTHYASNLIQKYMRKMKREYGSYYILKCDIKKYFYSIDKLILFNIMKKYISDKKLIDLTKLLIFDTNDDGIPIGNYTSQYFANIYLNELDYYVKNDLNIKYYVRYMDDFIILIDSKKTAKELKSKIESFLKNKLNLSLNNKSKYYPSDLGVNFCEYIIYETHKLLRKRSKKNIKKRIKLWNYLSQVNKLNEHKMILEWNSFIGHAKHSNSYNFIRSLDNKINNYRIDDKNKLIMK